LCYNCAHVVQGSYRLRIDYLVIGHVTQDLTPGGPVPGGTAYYAAVTAQRLGCRVALVTRAPSALVEQVQAAAPGLEVYVLPAEQATTFENRYHGNDRRQLLHHVAGTLAIDNIPVAWRQPAIVHLAPVAREVEPTLAVHFSTSLVCATPQGWLREWDQAGRVRYVPLRQPRGQLRAIDAMVFSAEDVNHDPDEMRRLIDSVPVVAVTRAAEGAVLYTQDGARPSPARPAELVDPTGAGDVFAAAFFTSLRRSGDPYEATAVANVVASFSIERAGVEGIPSRAAVEAWFARQASQRGIG
jgi:sugar/nucleoside kinase (ribokinase family)